MDKITLTSDDGDDIELYILEHTVLRGSDYYLAAASMDGDSDAYVLKDVSGKEDEEAVLIMVTDETELKVLGDIFSNLMEDTDIE